MSTDKKKVNTQNSLNQSIKASFNSTKIYLKEVWAELKKVTWPSRRQAMGETIVVISVVIFISLLIIFYDFILGIIFNNIYQR